MNVNARSAVGAGITVCAGLIVAAFVASPSPYDQCMLVGISGILSFVALQIMFRPRIVKTSHRGIQNLLMALTIFSILAFVSAVHLFRLVIVLVSEQ